LKARNRRFAIRARALFFPGKLHRFLEDLVLESLLAQQALEFFDLLLHSPHL
jgi:hypothetical protein